MPKATRPDVHRTRSKPHRRATAVIELALCLPVLFVLVLATMEACSMLYLQQKLKVTAYEGARVAIVPTAKIENVVHQCETLLDATNVQSYSISLSPSDPTTLNDGDYVTVTVSAPFSENSLAGGWLYTNKILSRSVPLHAE